MTFTLQLLSAVMLDALIGDPRFYPHPVRIIGIFCSWCERFSRAFIANLYLAGLVTVVLVLIATIVTVASLVIAASHLSPSLGMAVAVFLLYTTIASKDLLHHSNAVYSQLSSGGSLDLARAEVAKIVGRDTQQLERNEICNACIETVAENMVDGITAPLFFAILGSLFAPLLPLSAIGCAVIGAFTYKAINTMDSMLGYKNEKYLKFGWTAAKLDDVVNYIPARISGLFLIIAAFFAKLDYRRSAKIFFQDRLNHSSPNAGHPEAAVAGALGIRLGGPSYYFDTMVVKPHIGVATRESIADDIKATNRMVVIGSGLFTVVFLGLRLLIV
ncbi:MAG: adenosylcobinamide-phosphate synthase CbiB [Desulforhopalus sp.]